MCTFLMWTSRNCLLFNCLECRPCFGSGHRQLYFSVIVVNWWDRQDERAETGYGWWCRIQGVICFKRRPFNVKIAMRPDMVYSLEIAVIKWLEKEEEVEKLKFSRSWDSHWGWGSWIKLGPYLFEICCRYTCPIIPDNCSPAVGFWITEWLNNT